MRVLIIEDEYHAANRLIKLIQRIRPDYTIVNTLDSVQASVEWLKSNAAPDLILQDIQLGDGLSFDIFDHITITSSIIFTTAFDEYAIRAFKTNSIDYLLKPVTEEDLGFSLQKFETIHAKSIMDASVINSILRQLRPERRVHRLISKSGNFTTIIKVSDIFLLQSEDSVTFAYQKNGQKNIINQTLDQLTGSLDQSQFFRVSRNTLLGLDAIKKISPYINNRLSIESHISKLDAIIVSRERVKEFRAWIGETVNEL